MFALVANLVVDDSNMCIEMTFLFELSVTQSAHERSLVFMNPSHMTVHVVFACEESSTELTHPPSVSCLSTLIILVFIVHIDIHTLHVRNSYVVLDRR